MKAAAVIEYFSTDLQGQSVPSYLAVPIPGSPCLPPQDAATGPTESHTATGERLWKNQESIRLLQDINNTGIALITIQG